MRTPTAAAVAPLVLAAVLVTGCKGLTKGKEDAERAVAEFHEQLNQGRLDAIWEASADDLKRATSKQDFETLLSAVRRKLGDVTGSTNRGWNVRSFNLTTFVALQQDTTFATGKAVESFQFVVKGGRATLLAYNISSNDLITR